MPGTVVIPKIIEGIARPYGAGTITNAYMQRGFLFNTAAKSNFVAINTRAINLIGHDYGAGGRGSIVDIEFRLAVEFEANATTLLEYQWQARNLAPVESTQWLNICANTAFDVTDVWATAVMAGRFAPVGGFNSIPFELRMQFKTNHQNVGIARVLANSYIYYMYKIA